MAKRPRSFVFSSFLAKLNPSALIAILAFCFAVMVFFTLCFFGLWNTGVSNIFGTVGVAETSVAVRGTEAESAKKVRHVQQLRNTAEVHNAEGQTRNQIQSQTIAHLEDQHKNNQDQVTVQRKIQNADYNEVSKEPRKLASDSYLPFTSEPKYQVKLCEKSALKIGSFTYCLSATEKHEPRPLQDCGFECVPYLSKAEFKSAVDIFEAGNRLDALLSNFEASSPNFIGVKAWFKLFSVIGHHNAKVKFTDVFDTQLAVICSFMEGEELGDFQSVQNVCGLFY
jgi:hypothetical protein